MYEIVTDDHRYTTKDVVIAVVLFPYPWWVAGKTLLHVVSTSPEYRANEDKCLDASEGIGMPRKLRLRYCACFASILDPEQCAAKVFGR